MKSVGLFYWDGMKNFGDILSSFIVQSLISNQHEIKINDSNVDSTLIAIGSFIGAAESKTHIWGSGILSPNCINQVPEDINVHAVRGPLTRYHLMQKGIKCPAVFGDPALLTPMFYHPKILSEFEGRVGIIPHWSFAEECHRWKTSDKFIVIEPRMHWSKVCDRIASCDFVISSSLHGLILADAYHIPNIWLDGQRFTADCGIDEFKFLDYFASQERGYKKLSSIAEFNPDKCRFFENVDLELLKESFPF